MPAEYQCPYCRTVIAMEDVNVATDVALCRNCRRASSFATVAGVAAVSLAALDQPPKCIRVSRNLHGGVRVVYRRLPRMLLFLVPFTVLWTGLWVGDVFGPQIMGGRFDVGLSLPGLPFLIGTIILVTVVLFCAFGRWEMVLQRGEGSVFVGLGPLGRRRRFTYNRTTTVRLTLTDLIINDVAQAGICVRSDGEEFVFGPTMKEEAKQFMAATIIQAINDLR